MVGSWGPGLCVTVNCAEQRVTLSGWQEGLPNSLAVLLAGPHYVLIHHVVRAGAAGFRSTSPTCNVVVIELKGQA